ncbi:class I SAM-dependent methyltransferase [Paenibacillus sp. IB182496]|uniref:Class I SAM-dependent methyltransferase n=1 Tax=Paenibacillus sabuli TaxID=2772509 RepID=A0A927BRC5_9BACL|nr:class I SAM-dependent methyltransferase [Paenibacillus sabuli]MBD2845336.1 class I SAM-dependent methyltransferase [Paenibacillus sabuli]
MGRALTAIRNYRKQQLTEDALQEEPWLAYLVRAEARVVNVERIASLRELDEANPVLDYVERSLALLEEMELSYWMKELLEEVLAWSETAKGGTLRERLRWQEAGINCRIHNIGSAQLYARSSPESSARTQTVLALIEGHGLIGQQLRGEVPMTAAEDEGLTRIAESGAVTTDELERLLQALTACVIGAVSPELQAQTQVQADAVIAALARGRAAQRDELTERLRRMRAEAIRAGEAFDETYAALDREHAVGRLLEPLQGKTFWYAEPATRHVSLRHFLQIMTLAARHPAIGEVRHISLEPLMASLYYDYRGAKKINVYKLRMLEHYLNALSWDAVACESGPAGVHLRAALDREPAVPDTLVVAFAFSPAAEKLIEFCMEAEKSPLYERAVLMLFDLFGLRRDAYDRFHNEDTYLADMNASVDYKRVLVEQVVGRRVVDIGPGGGVLLDLLEQERPETEPLGIDIAVNVVEALNRKKHTEGRRWQVMQGDALKLPELLGPASVDTVIFSSILHELYSYVPFEGRRFNQQTIEAALTSAFEAIAPGGRIVIRDGVKSEPDEPRIIRFLRDDGMAWLRRYAQDFAGRAIRFEPLGEREARLPVNDAMEFLYTYTWGEEAYVHEVQEQFGVFTLREYEDCIRRLFGARARILVSRAYLQAGYTEALADKVELLDAHGAEVPLPDSTCLLVIEKADFQRTD